MHDAAPSLGRRAAAGLFSLLAATPAAIPIELPDENALLADAHAAVARAYVDPAYGGVDWAAARATYVKRRYKNMAEARAATAEMLALLDDRYTRYVSPAQLEALTARFKSTKDVGGVGVTLTEGVAGGVELAAVQESRPASLAGLRAGDELLEVDGVRMAGAGRPSLDEVAALLLGPLDVPVALVYRRGAAAAPATMSLRRAPLGSGEVRASSLGSTALITISTFSADVTAPSLARALAEVSRATSLVIDLRGNPGGDFTSAVEAAGLFLPANAVVVRTLRRPDPSGGAAGGPTTGEILRTQQAGGYASDGRPLVLLVNQGTASAAEVFAGALLDNQRAEVVGEPTFGKGLVQSIVRLSDGGAVVCTVAKYRTPSGRDINGRGVGISRECAWSQGTTLEQCVNPLE